MTDEQTSKRELLKKAAYIAPMILILTVAPSFASSGSGLAERTTRRVTMASVTVWIHSRLETHQLMMVQEPDQAIPGISRKTRKASPH
jgi:hypothetical protein